MIRPTLFAALLLGTALSGLAQQASDLPAPADYRGEIRRGQDGKLTAIEEPRARPLSAVPATLIVGPQERLRTIAEAAKAAHDGDVIEIRPGEYHGDTAVWTQDNLTIRGGNPRPVLIADGKNAEGKALWVIRGGKVRIENIEFRGARVKEGNGAGIRFERGHLSVHRCAFIDNETGILTGNSVDLSLEISDSEFADAPRHDGDLHHLLYVGAIDRFVLTGSRFANGYRGHLVKSRARENHVRYNLLADGPGGRASYELEFPNAGIAYVIGNIIEQSTTTENPVIVSYGAEGRRWPDNALYFAHNTLINDRHSGVFLAIATDKLGGDVESWVVNNLTVGDGDLFPPAYGRFEGNLSASRRDLVDHAGIPARLKNGSPLRGSVRIPGSARDIDLMPTMEFVFPAGQRPVSPSNALSPGALQ